MGTMEGIHKMPAHSTYEQYLLELINAERAKAGVQPLAFDNDLSEAAEGHTHWMIVQDVFSHTGSGGSSSTQRMKAAGYVLSGSWATGENIAWATTRTPAGYADEVKLLHTNLMNSSGHRANLLNGNFREVGLGFEVGEYRGRNVAMLTEDFAKTGSDLFLTGVAFDDRDGDKFYDPGEGLGGLAVTAKTSTGLTYKTTTTAGGGYDLALKPGTYTVTFSGSNIVSKTQTVTIGTKNVKRDLVDPTMTSGTLSADAAADDSDTVPAPTTNLATDSNSGDTVGNDWLAQFLNHSGGAGQGVVKAGLRGAGTGGDHMAGLAGDQLHFRPSVSRSANTENISDQFDEIFSDLAAHHAGGSVASEIAADIHAPTDAADAAQAALTKLVAQIAAHSGSHSDLAV